MKKHLSIIVGTRPELIKLNPIVRELKCIGNLDVKLVFSGQHSDLLKQTSSDLLIFPDIELRSIDKKAGLASRFAALLDSIYSYIHAARPDAIVALGDTLTAMASAQASFYAGVPFIHVEAGLRSNDVKSPFPEEMHRRLIGQLASLHICPSASARKNLLAIGINERHIKVIGNSGFDALRNELERSGLNGLLNKEIWNSYANFDGAKILLTLHRRESIPTGITNVCKAIVRLRDLRPGKIRVVVPYHPNPDVHSIIHRILENKKPEIRLVSSLPYSEMVHVLSLSDIVVTDSGGVMEEGAYLGKSVIVARNSTERQDIEKLRGISRVGPIEDRIFNALLNRVDHVAEIRSRLKTSSNRMFNQYVSGRIADAIIDFFSAT